MHELRCVEHPVRVRLNAFGFERHFRAELGLILFVIRHISACDSSDFLCAAASHAQIYCFACFHLAEYSDPVDGNIR